MCSFEYGFKGEVINHMSINHDEVDKECFEDCRFCKMFFFTEKGLKKHEEEREKFCAICERCIIMESFDQKYFSAKEH